MNKEDFNKYLVSIGGLIREWKPERGPIVDASTFFEHGDGWFELEKNLIEELKAAGWDLKVSQIKEKFGGLRFYIPSGYADGDKWVEIEIPQAYRDIIHKYENLSYKICEKCGKAGVLREGNWIRTLCDEHSNGAKPNEGMVKFFTAYNK